MCPVSNLYSLKETWWVKDTKINLEHSLVKHLLNSLQNNFVTQLTFRIKILEVSLIGIFYFLITYLLVRGKYFSLVLVGKIIFPITIMKL